MIYFRNNLLHTVLLSLAEYCNFLPMHLQGNVSSLCVKISATVCYKTPHSLSVCRNLHKLRASFIILIVAKISIHNYWTLCYSFILRNTCKYIMLNLSINNYYNITGLR